MDDVFLGKCVVAEHQMAHENECLVLTDAAVFVAFQVGLKVSVIAVL